MTLTNDELRRWAAAVRSGLFPLWRGEHLAWQHDGTIHLHPVGVLAVVLDPGRFPDWPVGWDRRLESELEHELDKRITDEADVDLLGAVDHAWRASKEPMSPEALADVIALEAAKRADRRMAEMDGHGLVPFALTVLLCLAVVVLLWVGSP